MNIRAGMTTECKRCGRSLACHNEVGGSFLHAFEPMKDRSDSPGELVPNIPTAMQLISADLQSRLDRVVDQRDELARFAKEETDAKDQARELADEAHWLHIHRNQTNRRRAKDEAWEERMRQFLAAYERREWK